jgi:hypothetical protein
MLKGVIIYSYGEKKMFGENFTDEELMLVKDFSFLLPINRVLPLEDILRFIEREYDNWDKVSSLIKVIKEQNTILQEKVINDKELEDSNILHFQNGLILWGMMKVKSFFIYIKKNMN